MKRRKAVEGSPAKKRNSKRRSTLNKNVNRKKRKETYEPQKEEQEASKQPKGKSKRDFQKISSLMKCRLEYQRLQKEQMDTSIPPKGIYILPGRDRTEWHGVKFVQGGMYKGLILKFFFKLPPRFPREELVIKSFQPKPQDMFHPLVHPLTGVIQCFASPSPTPPRSQPFISEILNGLNSVFENAQVKRWRPDDCQNPLALTLAMQNPIEFSQRIQQCIRRSLEGKYVNHPNSLIRFNPLSDHEYEIQKAKICMQENLEAIGRPHDDMKSNQMALLNTSFNRLNPNPKSINALSALNESRIQAPRHSLAFSNNTVIAT